MEFIVAYDIADSKRLRKVAKKLEKIGIRIEYSIFYVKITKEEMTEFAIELSKIINEKEDDIRIYEITEYGIALGKATPLEDIFILR